MLFKSFILGIILRVSLAKNRVIITIRAFWGQRKSAPNNLVDRNAIRKKRN
jgi:hypothetical protein